MTLIIVETKVIIADNFGNKVTEVSTTQRSTEGNPRFFAAETAGLGKRCMDSIQMMIQTEYGKVPD